MVALGGYATLWMDGYATLWMDGWLRYGWMVALGGIWSACSSGLTAVIRTLARYPVERVTSLISFIPKSCSRSTQTQLLQLQHCGAVGQSRVVRHCRALYFHLHNTWQVLPHNLSINHADYGISSTAHLHSIAHTPHRPLHIRFRYHTLDVTFKCSTMRFGGRGICWQKASVPPGRVTRRNSDTALK